jgi:6,7-dimethyl-8-ribityllumazine synthase
MALTLDGLAIGNGILTVENEAQALPGPARTRRTRAASGQGGAGDAGAQGAVRRLSRRSRYPTCSA